MKRQTQHAFAVVRVEEAPQSNDNWKNRITVKEILRTMEEAETEVVRLNQLNEGKRCVYFWQTTRLVGFDKVNK